MRIKHIIVRCLLIAEMGAFVHMYIFGENGLQLVQVQQQQLACLNNNITQLQEEIRCIEGEIAAWELDDFYKEKIAREQLQMARKDDKLFYIGS